MCYEFIKYDLSKTAFILEKACLLIGYASLRRFPRLKDEEINFIIGSCGSLATIDVQDVQWFLIPVVTNKTTHWSPTRLLTVAHGP